MRYQNTRMAGSAVASLHAKVLDEIGRAIVRGELAPGDPMPNADDWGAAHGVSRTVMREVMKVLAGKGMVESRPKIGTRIRERSAWNFLDPDVLAWRYSSTSSLEDARALFELRRGIEPLAAALAARRRRPDDIARLYTLYERMEQAADDNDRFTDADLAFHQAILRMTGNELVGSLAALTETAMVISFRLSDDNPLGQRPSLPLHKRVCDCIAARDEDGVRAAITDLLDLAEEDVRRSLAARGGGAS
jgi:DNA-binding FadR family transcriptional regulator